MSDNPPAEIDSPIDLEPQRTVDVEKALKLRLAGRTYQEIADKFGVSKQAIQQRLAKFEKFLDEPELTRSYRDNEADLLDGVRMQVVAHMVDPETLKKASLNNAAFTFTQLLNGSRLLRGQSTQNIHQLTSIIEAADAARRGKSLKSEQDDKSGT